MNRLLTRRHFVAIAVAWILAVHGIVAAHHVASAAGADASPADGICYGANGEPGDSSGLPGNIRFHGCSICCAVPDFSAPPIFLGVAAFFAESRIVFRRTLSGLRDFTDDAAFSARSPPGAPVAI